MLRRLRTSAVLAFASLIVFPIVACSGASPENGVTGNSGAACGNGKLDPGESCDTGIASGPSACPSSCDDGNPCTTDALTGEGCNVTCTHEPIANCASGPTCGNGKIDPGEECDTGIANGKTGACPTSCESDNACVKAVVTGSGCTQKCQVSQITQRINGDGCCPAGATHANDSDCMAAFGETCQKSQDCATGICHIQPHCGPLGCTCTKFCNLNDPISACGGKGFFCTKTYTQGPTCTFVVDTGLDTDDKFIGLGVATIGNIASAKDVDMFIFDATNAGSYKVEVTPIDVTPIIDLAVDIYGEDGELAFTVNDFGLGKAEIYSMTVPLPNMRAFIAVRTANTNAGNYRITVSAN